MKNKRLIIGSALTIMVVFCVGAAFGGKFRIFSSELPDGIPMNNNQAEEIKQPVESGELVYGSSLSIDVLANVETEEEAEKIAKMYQISLVNVSDGIALYSSNISYDDLEKARKENDYPKLYLNGEVRAFKDNN